MESTFLSQTHAMLLPTSQQYQSGQVIQRFWRASLTENGQEPRIQNLPSHDLDTGK